MTGCPVMLAPMIEAIGLTKRYGRTLAVETCPSRSSRAG